jgi:hypothetical protein
MGAAVKVASFDWWDAYPIVPTGMPNEKCFLGVTLATLRAQES